MAFYVVTTRTSKAAKEGIIVDPVHPRWICLHKNWKTTKQKLT